MPLVRLFFYSMLRNTNSWANPKKIIMWSFSASDQSRIECWRDSHEYIADWKTAKSLKLAIDLNFMQLRNCKLPEECAFVYGKLECAVASAHGLERLWKRRLMNSTMLRHWERPQKSGKHKSFPSLLLRFNCRFAETIQERRVEN